MRTIIGPKANAGWAHDAGFLGACAVLFLASATGTVVWCAPMSGGMPMPGGWTMSMAWMRMPGQSWSGAAAAFMAMWTLMMVAMMLPCLVPMLSGYRCALRRLNVQGARLAWLTTVGGAAYFVFWALVGALAYPVGMALAAAEMRSPSLSRFVPGATAIVAILAGAFQTTGWKARQLDHCRQDLNCAQSLACGSYSAWRQGLRFGTHCGACCLGFMILLLVGGVMNLIVMGVLTVAIAAERIVPMRSRLPRIIGAIIVLIGVVAGINALWL